MYGRRSYILLLRSFSYGRKGIAIKQRNNGKRGGTKQLTVCAMLAALGVVLLYIGSLIEIVDISMAVIASLACVVVVIEYGGGAPWLVFFVTALLSLLLVPQKTPAVMYALFFGYYPILKEKFEKMRLVTGWIFKEAVFNIALAAIILCMRFVLLAYTDVPIIMYVVAVVLCEAIFVLYDVALSRLISFYVYRLRKRLKIK